MKKDRTKTVPTVLSIAGFDGSGGAGIQADTKTISALGCYAMNVLTALPVQNTQGVRKSTRYRHKLSMTNLTLFLMINCLMP